MHISDLRIKLFADGANLTDIDGLASLSYIRGFTTNPTLMRKAGVQNYERFARQVLERIPDRPVSFEVFSDEFDEMERQARRISGWGTNVYIKIPVTNTRRESAGQLIARLTRDGLRLNVTALLTLDQVRLVSQALCDSVPTIVSIFAGRIADTGCDPVPIMAEALKILSDHPSVELLWASPREVLNIIQADQIGCHIITATSEILGKLKLLGTDLTDYSLETVKMFYDDAQAAGYQL